MLEAIVFFKFLCIIKERKKVNISVICLTVSNVLNAEE